MPNRLPTPDAGLATPPKMFEVCCGEVDDNDNVLTELVPKILAVVLVVGIVLAL